MGVRFAFLIGAFSIAYTSLLFRLYDVQVAEQAQYLDQAKLQYAATGAFHAERGTIYFTDRDGNRFPAATNKNHPLIYAVPEKIEDPLEAAHQLAPILGLDPTRLAERFSDKESAYTPLVRKADELLIPAVEKLNIKGIYVSYVPERSYPFRRLAAHLLGFVGLTAEDDVARGRYGLEKEYDGVLTGTEGKLKGNRVVAPEAGEDVVLTIDPTIQTEAERILKSLVEEYGAVGGTVIVQEPSTGKILTVGSVPSFDPNAYGEAQLSNFINPAVQGMYEPGSVFKVFTMAAGFDAGVVDPETTYYDAGSVTVSGRTIKNWDLKAHGTLTMANVIEKSVNTGAVFVQQELGRESFRNYVERFGFGKETGIDLPGELPGDIRPLFRDRASDVAFATASFGQGVAVTPIQLVTAVSAIANGGKLMRPYVNVDTKPKVVRRVLSSRAAEAITGVMVSAVDKAYVAKIEGYTIAGKTGTAQVPDFERGGYTTDVINTYVGFGPTDDPQFTVLIKIVKPKGAPLAGLTVVPAFRELAQFILNYYSISPDRI